MQPLGVGKAKGGCSQEGRARSRLLPAGFEVTSIRGQPGLSLPTVGSLHLSTEDFPTFLLPFEE